MNETTRIIIFKCDCCRGVFRLTVADVKRGSPGQEGLLKSGMVLFSKYRDRVDYYAWCRRCESAVTQGKRIRGVVRADVPCDARCTTAKGHSCNCACGGKNHGAQHGIDDAARAEVRAIEREADALVG